jgi:adenosylcobinamide-GDP ribazoletransferase
MIDRFRQLCQTTWAQLNAAVMFYTCLPLPRSLPVEFHGMAQFAPMVGVGIGLLAGAIEAGLRALGLTPSLTAVLVVAGWLTITGGLHLDGAMDAADGLAVTDPDRRLAVMTDSRSGAFGVMAAIVILGIKTVALASLTQGQLWALVAACGWGRWGQLAAIVRYPYLKPIGKGAFHREALTSPWQTLPMLLMLLGLCCIPLWLGSTSWQYAFGLAAGGSTIALLMGHWFNIQFGGQTGDTYGAIVEWTEVFVLVWANVLLAISRLAEL